MIENSSISLSTSKRNLYAWIFAVIVDIPEINFWDKYSEKITNACNVSPPYNIFGYVVTTASDTFSDSLQSKLWCT